MQMKGGRVDGLWSAERVCKGVKVGMYQADDHLFSFAHQSYDTQQASSKVRVLPIDPPINIDIIPLNRYKGSK